MPNLWVFCRLLCDRCDYVHIKIHIQLDFTNALWNVLACDFFLGNLCVFYSGIHVPLPVTYLQVCGVTFPQCLLPLWWCSFGSASPSFSFYFSLIVRASRSCWSFKIWLVRGIMAFVCCISICRDAGCFYFTPSIHKTDNWFSYNDIHRENQKVSAAAGLMSPTLITSSR